MKFRHLGERFLFLTILVLTSSLIASAQTYQGRAYAAKATVSVVGQPVVTAILADTGNMADNGNGTSLNGNSATLANILNVGSSSSSTSGGSNVSSASGGLHTVSLGITNVNLGVTALQAASQSSCPNGSTSGGTTITGLTLNGQSVTVTGAVNQTIAVSVLGNQIGTLVINEQIQEPYTLQVNAVHLTVTDPTTLTRTEVVLGSALTGVSCSVQPAFNLFSGLGQGVTLQQTNILSGRIGSIISDTGSLHPAGGNVTSTTIGANVGTLLTTGTVTSSTSGGIPGGNANSTQSSAGVDSTGISVLGVISITANALGSNTQCTCSLSAPTCTASTNVASISVSTPLGGLISIPITGAPNQSVSLPLGLGSLVINERLTNVVGGHGRAVATPLRVTLNVLGLDATETAIGTSDSGMTCGLAPSAATVSVGGRVLDPYGRPVSGATVMMYDTHGNIRQSVSNPFGYYMFDDVESGGVYSMTVKARNYTFPQRVVAVDDNITDFDITASGGGSSSQDSFDNSSISEKGRS